MIVVEEDKCVRCGQCVDICHEHCMATDEESVSIVHRLCSMCTQCIAICPQQALSWEGISPVAFDKARLPSSEQIDELLKQRRTTRFFKKQRIDRLLLEEIVGYGIYAPTNNYDLRAIVVDDEQIVREFDRTILKYASFIYRLFFKSRLVFNFIRRFTPAMQEKDKVKMEASIERGYSFDLPAAMVFVVGDKRIALSVESASYAIYNMMLYAQSKGIGTCLLGPSRLFLDRRKEVRRRLNLARHEHILGGFLIGFPAVTFRNKVEGKALPIQWNGEFSV